MSLEPCRVLTSESEIRGIKGSLDGAVEHNHRDEEERPVHLPKADDEQGDGQHHLQPDIGEEPFVVVTGHPPHAAKLSGSNSESGVHPSEATRTPNRRAGDTVKDVSKVSAIAAIVVSVGFFVYGTVARNHDGSGVGDPIGVSYLRLSDDRLTVQLEFQSSGGPFEPRDRCSTDHAVTGVFHDNILEVEIVVTKGIGHDHIDLLGLSYDQDCLGTIYDRTIELELQEPFTGSEIRDATSGYRLLFDRPDGLAQLTGLPEGWILRVESGAPLVHRGGWIRVYSPADDPSKEVVLVQAFGQDARVWATFTYPEEITIGSVSGQLTTINTGEQVLLWREGTDGFALFAYEAVFSLEELVELAESLEV